MLFLASLFTSYSNSQNVTGATLAPGEVYSTGNIVQDTIAGSGTTPWVGGVYQDNLTCWAGGDSGYCGPNAIVRPGNNINFSYGSTYLYQQQHINTVLPSSTGLQVSGFNFGFTAKNGNGWDNGQTDSLIALVRFWDNTGNKGKDNLLYGTSYDLNRQFNWTTFNFGETFTKPLAVPDVGLVQYGFIGRDNNGWAGPYGPEIYQVSFSVKYSVDPCATNPLYSPTCPGYLEALAKLAPPPPPPPPELAFPPPGSPPSPPGSPPPPGSTPQQTGSDTPPPPNPAERPGQPQSAVAANSAPSATSPQAKIGEVAVAGAPAKSSSGPSMSTIMSILSTEAAKVGAVEKSVVQTATSEAQAAAQQAQQQAESVAASLTTTSIASSQSQSVMSTSGPSAVQQTASTISLQNNTQSNVAAVQVLRSATPIQTEIVSTSQANYGVGPEFVAAYKPMDSSQTQLAPLSVDYSLTAPVFVDSNRKNTGSDSIEVELPKIDSLKMGTSSTLNDYMNDKPFVSLMGMEPTQDGMVKRNVEPNEAAGGVDIASIATQPKGYDAYAQMSLSDAAFYKVDTIYKNQNTVDNVRVMRGLTGGSDRLHQNMVDQQYNIRENK